MTCEPIKPLLSASIDRDLTIAERELVDAHCRICPACRAERAAHFQTRADVRSLPLLEPPPGIRRGVWRAIEEIDRSRQRSRAARRGLTGLAAVAAGVLVMLAVALPAGPAAVGDRIRQAILPSHAQADETVTLVVQVVDGALVATPTFPPTATPLPPPAKIVAEPAPTEADPIAVSASPVTRVPATATPTPLPPPQPSVAPPVPTTRPAGVAVAPTSVPARSPAATVTVARPPATLTPTPMPIRPPATATPTPDPTQPPTATPPVGPVVGAIFAKVYAENAEVRGRLGAPLQSERGLEGRAQPFEQGLMVWLADGKVIYVVYREGRTWVRLADTWSPDEATPAAEPAPPGRYQPQRAFGKIWRENPAVRERLGWGTAPEQTYAARLQRFERGLMLTTASGAVQVLYEDGAWQ